MMKAIMCLLIRSVGQNCCANSAAKLSAVNQALFFFLFVYIYFLSVATDIKDEEVRIPKRLFLGMYLLCLS